MERANVEGEERRHHRWIWRGGGTEGMGEERRRRSLEDERVGACVASHTRVWI
jgi:hypothetical protein